MGSLRDFYDDLDDQTKWVLKFIRGAVICFLVWLVFDWFVIKSKDPFKKSFNTTLAEEKEDLLKPVRKYYRMKLISVLTGKQNKYTGEPYCSLHDLLDLYIDIDHVDDINLQTDDGTNLLIGLARSGRNTPLKYARYFSANRNTITRAYSLFIQKLFKMGIDLNARDTLKRTALIWSTINWALETRETPTESDLVSAFKCPKDSIYEIPLHRNLTLELLYRQRALSEEKLNPINFRDRDGNTALAWAAKLNSLEPVKYLLAYGADKSIRNNSYQLPVDLTDNADIEKLLAITNKKH